MIKLSPAELDHIAKCTRDPTTLPPGMLDEMKAAKVGPFIHSDEEWAAALKKVFADKGLKLV